MRRSPAWTVLWSIAAAAHAQVELQPDAPALKGESAQPAGNGQSTGNGLRLAMPPVLWSGTLGFDLNYNRIDGEATRRQQLITAGVGAMTYLYAPWFANVSGNLNLTKGVTHYADAASSSETNDFATGNLLLNLFPRSRFPTEARYEVSDTRLDSTLGGGVDYRTSLFALTQRYRPADNAFTLSASYERRTQDGLSFGRDTQDYYLIDFASSWKRQQINATLTRNRSRTEGTGEETDFTSVFARHSFYSDTALTIDTGASWTHSDDQLRLGDRVVTVAQAASVAIWNSPNRPLTVTGSFRALSFQQDAANDSNSLAAGVGANYELSPNARLGGSLLFTRFNNESALTAVGLVSGNYQGDTLKLGPIDWTWYTGAGLGTQRNDTRADASLSAQLGQTFSRTWILGASNWSVSLGQALSGALERRAILLDDPLLNDRVSRAVAQTLAFSWSMPGERGNAFGRLALSDARQLDREQSRFQQVNFQLSGTHEFDRYRRFTADLTVQYTTQSSLVLRTGQGLPFIGQSSQKSESAGGEVNYTHNRVFNVPRLNFTSRFRVSLNTQSQSDQLVPLPDRDLASWENRLDYRVGRLDSSIVLRVSRVDERQQVFAMWRLQRSFGG